MTRALRHVSTQGIVLTRTDFDEAARIISFLTPDQGKVRTLARGVRKQKSKLAGGIELFSVSDISYLIGRGDIYTLTSTRLVKHYANIVKDLDRTDAAYDFIKLISKNTEDIPEPAYFELLQSAFVALDDDKVNPDLVRLWFYAHLLKLAGHSPNLRTDAVGEKLAEVGRYVFDFDKVAFKTDGHGHNSFDANDIKFLRLVFSDNSPKTLSQVKDSASRAARCLPLVQNITSHF